MQNYNTLLELTPANGRKSFNHKAMIGRNRLGGYTLFSYGTPVAESDAEGRLRKLWDGYSLTTMTHVNSFCAWIGHPSMTKSEWIDMELAVN